MPMLVALLTLLVAAVAGLRSVPSATLPQHSSSSSFRVLPSRIEFCQVSQHFPLTLQRRLFSSVPYREWALHNVSFTVESELLLLLGASSSGKTTILQMILHGHDRQPTTGSVALSSRGRCGTTGERICAAPIYLDQRPPLERSKSISRVIMGDDRDFLSKIPASLLQRLTEELLIHVDLTSRANQTPAELSPSEQYRVELARASLRSMLSRCGPFSDSGDDDEPSVLRCLPAPILLLDEWLDKETSLVVRTVQASMERLVKHFGAVILVVSHKPERWDMSTGTCSHIRLSIGKIMSLHSKTATNENA